MTRETTQLRLRVCTRRSLILYCINRRFLFVDSSNYLSVRSFLLVLPLFGILNSGLSPFSLPDSFHCWRRINNLVFMTFVIFLSCSSLCLAAHDADCFYSQVLDHVSTRVRRSDFRTPNTCLPATWNPTTCCSWSNRRPPVDLILRTCCCLSVLKITRIGPNTRSLSMT